MIIMSNRNLVGRCGIYCGSCIIYRAYKDSEQLRQRVAEREKCRAEDVRCEGCQTVLTDGWESKEWGKNCKIVQCLEARGVEFCNECDTYPDCENFRKLANHSLKYGESLDDNLKKIKTGKVEEWLKEEEKKWSCHRCGKPTSRHLEECHWCGEKIETKEGTKAESS